MIVDPGRRVRVDDVAARVHAGGPVVDLHNDFLVLAAHHRSRRRLSWFADSYLPRMRGGGINVEVAAICMEGSDPPEGHLRRTLRLLEEARALEREHAAVVVAESAADLDRSLEDGQLALVLALEGIECIGPHLELLDTMYRLGVRCIGLCHWGRTLYADGSGEDAAGSRLSSVGVAAVQRIWELGLALDLSHLGWRGIDHVLELGTGPVFASHSCCRALNDHHRNLSDDHLRAIAASGGVVGVNFLAGFLRADARATLDDLLDHIEHVATVAGIDHAAIGSDFIREYMQTRLPDVEPDPVGGGIEGFEMDPTDLPLVTEGLLDRGLPVDHVRRIMGGNALRFLRRVLGPGAPRT